MKRKLAALRNIILSIIVVGLSVAIYIYIIYKPLASYYPRLTPFLENSFVSLVFVVALGVGIAGLFYKLHLFSDDD